MRVFTGYYQVELTRAEAKRLVKRLQQLITGIEVTQSALGETGLTTRSGCDWVSIL